MQASNATLGITQSAGMSIDKLLSVSTNAIKSGNTIVASVTKMDGDLGKMLTGIENIEAKAKEYANIENLLPKNSGEV